MTIINSLMLKIYNHERYYSMQKFINYLNKLNSKDRLYLKKVYDLIHLDYLAEYNQMLNINYFCNKIDTYLISSENNNENNTILNYKEGGETVKKNLFVFLNFMFCVLNIISFGIHCWTVGIIGNIYGLFAAVIAFIFPIGSEVFLIFSFASYTGTFLTLYNICIFTYVITYIITIICMSYLAQE